MLNITIEKIIELSQPLVFQYIEDQEEYQSDICKIFNAIDDLPMLYSLLTQEHNEYSDERTLQIAKILEKAGADAEYDRIHQSLERNNISILDIRITFDLDNFRKKPALYFYERAAANNSIRAMERVAFLLNSGEGNIKKNPERSKRLYERAAECGDISSLVHLHRDDAFYKAMIANGNYMAEIVLFLRCFENNRKFFAKRHLDRLLRNCSQDDRDEIIEYLNDERSGDFSSVIGYIRGEAANFKIVTASQLLKHHRGW